MVRRVASTYLKIGDKILKNYVVEIDGSKVVDYYPLEGEPPMTEWLGGTIEIIDGKAFKMKNEKFILVDELTS